MTLLWKVKHEGKKKRNNEKSAWYKWLFLMKRKEARSFRREICQYWLIASLEITVTVSISIWTFNPSSHMEAELGEMIFQLLLNLLQPQVEPAQEYLGFTETIQPFRPRSKTPSPCWNYKWGSFQGDPSGSLKEICECLEEQSRAERKWPDSLSLENCEWPEFEQEQLLPCDWMLNKRPGRKSLSCQGLISKATDNAGTGSNYGYQSYLSLVYFGDFTVGSLSSGSSLVWISKETWMST